MNPQQYQFLLGTLGQEDGRKVWREYKLKNKWLDLSTADLKNLALSDYDLSGANLSTALLVDANLTGSDLSDALLSYSDLRRASLRNAAMDRADLNCADLREANLSDACLEKARLCKAKLAKAILTGADLSGADLTGADLRGASLRYVRLTGACLAGVNVAEADLTGAVFDEDAPLQMLNLEQSAVDDRKYREMRSRPTGYGRPGPGEAAKEKVAVARHSRHAQAKSAAKQDKAGAKGHAKGNGSAAKNDAPRLKAGSIPIRDKEPDLSTLQGCSRVLEVPVDAALEEIVKSFRKKAKIYHPDKVRHLSERLQGLAADEFRHLRQAYETLTRRVARPLVGVSWPEGLASQASPYDYSAADYELLARLNPANINILYNMAWKYFEEGCHAEALAGFQRVLALNPDDEDAQYNIVIVRLYSELVLPEFGPNS